MSIPSMSIPSIVHPIQIIVAVARNGVIGRDGRLPWSIPADWQHFLRTTAGQTCLLGRRCYEELREAGEAEGQRTCLVVTRQHDLADPDRKVVTVPSLTAALDLAQTLPGELWICGGQSIYEATLPLAARLLLTEVHAEVDGDTWFPDWRPHFPHEVSAQPGSDHGYRYTIRDLRRERHGKGSGGRY